jgi:hypothetical protein
VVSLPVQNGQLTGLDFHQLDDSLVGCSFPQAALQKRIHSTARAWNPRYGSASCGRCNGKRVLIRWNTSRRT